MIRGAFELAKVVTQMRMRVTQRDIDEGVQSNCFHCPVARAVKRVFKATGSGSAKSLSSRRQAHSRLT